MPGPNQTAHDHEVAAGLTQDKQFEEEAHEGTGLLSVKDEPPITVGVWLRSLTRTVSLTTRSKPCAF